MVNNYLGFIGIANTLIVYFVAYYIYAYHVLHRKAEQWQFKSDEIISKLDEIDNEISVTKFKTQEKIMEIHRIESAVNEDIRVYENLVVCVIYSWYMLWIEYVWIVHR